VIDGGASMLCLVSQLDSGLGREVPYSTIEGACYSRKHIDCQILLASFHISHVIPVATNTFGQLLLCQAHEIPLTPNGFSE
jgi:hypothetical protein